MGELVIKGRNVQLGGDAVAEHAIIAALEQANGNISEAAELLGVRRHLLASAINRNEHLREVHMDFLEAGIDCAQSVILAAVKSGNVGAATFVLETLGKTRGYSKKTELDVKQKEDFSSMSMEEIKGRLLGDPQTVATLRELVADADRTIDSGILPYHSQKADE